MAEKWRRCDTCRKVKAVEEFTEEQPTCRLCLAPPVRSGARSGAAGEASSGRGAPAVSRVATIAPRDLKGRGDPEVRSRRARLRAVDRLIELYPEEFAVLLEEERRGEQL